MYGNQIGFAFIEFIEGMTENFIDGNQIFY